MDKVGYYYSTLSVIIGSGYICHWREDFWNSPFHYGGIFAGTVVVAGSLAIGTNKINKKEEDQRKYFGELECALEKMSDQSFSD